MSGTVKKALTWLVVLVVFVALMWGASLLTGPEGTKLQGLAWLLWTLIAAVIIYIIYFATAASEAWVVGTRQVVYMAIGAALYGVLSWWANAVALPSVSLVSLRPTICLPIFFGFVFGPVVGFFTGTVGNILGDFLTGWGVFPVWDIGNGFIGLVPGLVLLFADKKRSLNALTIAVAVLVVIAMAIIRINPVVADPWSGEETNFLGWVWVFLIGGVVVIVGRFVLEIVDIDLAAVNIWGTLGIIVGIGFASIADIWVNGYTFFVAMVGEFAPAAGSNILNAMILTPILLAAYQAVQARTGRYAKLPTEVLMSGELSAQQQEAVKDLSQAVAKDLVSGKSQKATVKQLTKQGWTKESAQQFVGNIARTLDEYRKSPEGRRVLAEQYRSRMIRGLLWTVAGIVVTALTYSAAVGQGGGTYYICWGAVLLGVIDFLVGLVGWLQHQ